MRRRNLINVIAVLIGFFYLTGLTFAAEEKKEEMKMYNKTVVLRGFEGAIPVTLTSKVGTTVIWVNHSRSPLELLFLDKKVVLACGSPVNFFVGKDGAYESAKIPFASTASLCFMEKGRYEYIIKVSRAFYPMSGIERENRGTILIK